MIGPEERRLERRRRKLYAQLVEERNPVRARRLHREYREVMAALRELRGGGETDD